MALANFTVPFNGLVAPAWAPLSSAGQSGVHHANTVNSLLYGPAGHQEADLPPPGSDPFFNNPYGPPQRSTYQGHNNNYLPPPPPQSQPQSPGVRLQPQQFGQPTIHRGSGSGTGGNGATNAAGGYSTGGASQRNYGEASYGPPPPPLQQLQQQLPPLSNLPPALQPPTAADYYGGFSAGQTRPFQQRPGQEQPAQQVPTATAGKQQSQPPATAPAGVGQRTSHGGAITTGGNGGNGASGVGGGVSVQTPLQNGGGNSRGGNNGGASGGAPVAQPPGYTRVQAGQGSRTQVHAVLDYDDDGDTDDYYDDEDDGTPVQGQTDANGAPMMATVTPIQGPIFLKNGTVPVVPLFSYPTVNNGSFVQIPIWWTALSVALGLDIRGDIIRGMPCVKRYHQLFCPSAGTSYPSEKIEKFIDDNKALMRRMYGDFQMTTQYGPPLQQTAKRKRNADGKYIVDPPGVPDMIGPPGSGPDPVREAGPTGDSYFAKWRSRRQTQTAANSRGASAAAAANSNNNSNSNNNNNNNRNQGSASRNQPPLDNPPGQGGENTGRVDACESKVEIVTPYWASNSAGKIRAIVNTQHFEQAIHQEVCTKVQTSRCGGDCGCEQKYKWHRLLAYDPDNDCKGIFMDWFLFPSCCVCRCNPL